MSKTTRSAHHMGTCACGKRRYPTRRRARKAAGQLYPGHHLSAYQCGDSWHFGHLDPSAALGNPELDPRPLPPPPARGIPCDWKDHNDPARGWRWSSQLRAWVPVCQPHSGGTYTTRTGDYVADVDQVPRRGVAL